MTHSKNALVTGATKGIGRAISLKLAEAGYHLLLNYHTDDGAAQELAGLIEKQQGSCELLKFDVGNPQAVAASLSPMFEEAERPIEVLVHNAGILADNALVWMKDEEWQKVLATNLDAFFYVAKRVVKRMILQHQGRIIAIASTAGQSGSRGQINYAASKGGLIAACKSLALEVAARGVTVNVVAPGFIETEMTKDVDTKKLHIPMKRMGKPAEVAAAVLFLASPDSSYITGQVLGVNGGIYM